MRRGPTKIRGGVAETPMPSCRFALVVRPRSLRQFQANPVSGSWVSYSLCNQR
jgi:hypothetical protein